MDDTVELTYKNKKKQRRIRCIGAIVAVILVFIIGFLIGYFAKKTKREDHEKERPNGHDKKAEMQKKHKDMMRFHEMFQSTVKAEALEGNLKYFSEKPHIAGSPRQKELADELERRFKEYGFDKVEKPEYHALLSKPDLIKKTRITIKYKNGTVIYQVKGEEQEGGSQPGVVQPFLGYSPSGHVKGELVYVNYGQVSDFQQLKNLSVNVTGKIAIMRYGKIYRGNKIANAHSYGAIGAILYSDPADYAMEGGEEENTYPNKAWLPASGVQRGSLYTMPGSGDPQTPGIAALTGMYRRPHNESELPPIPAHPMGYGDAIKFLQEMSGSVVPEDWKGTLGITYHLGPEFNRGEVEVELNVSNNLEEVPIYNVIGTIYGKEEPDRYVLIGNHRDAWVHGAIDASTGTSATAEIGRVLGELLKTGWRPRRTIKICSWGGEEYSLIGSTEWVEQHQKELGERAVVYLNTDTIVSGSYVLIASGSPLVKNTIVDFSKKVDDPNAHDDKKTVFDISLERNPSKNNPGKPAVGNLGSGSDYASFYQYAGVPSADFYYIFGYKNKTVFYPVYHSQHDTFNWTVKFVDPKFLFHKAMTQLTGGLLLQFADAPLLKMDVMTYAEALNNSLNSLISAYPKKLKDYAGSMDYLRMAVEKFYDTAKTFSTAREKVEEKLEKYEETSFAELRRLNDQMIQVERAFIHPYGLPERRLVRHVIFAPSKYNLYGASNFPGVSDILFKLDETKDYAGVDRQISIARQAILGAVDILTLIKSG